VRESYDSQEYDHVRSLSTRAIARRVWPDAWHDSRGMRDPNRAGCGARIPQRA